jgi:LPXTG-motif cell wall-anchored protein
MNTHKSLNTAAITSVAFFSLFGAQATHAAHDGNGNQQSESIEVALVAIDFYDAEKEVQDEAPGDDETGEDVAEDSPTADDPVAEIVIPDPDTNNPLKETNNDNEQDDPITEIVTPDPEEQDVDETPNDDTNDIEVAASLNVTADDTDHNALPATGMELSLAFLGLGLAGIGGTLLAVRRRLMIK